MFSFMLHSLSHLFFFFFNDTATTEIYTLSLHDALPIFASPVIIDPPGTPFPGGPMMGDPLGGGCPVGEPCHQNACGWYTSVEDRKSTRLNSSHDQISYAVFCLKKKKTPQRYRMEPHLSP